MWFYGEMKKGNHKEQSMEDIKGKYGATTLKDDRNKKQIV